MPREKEDYSTNLELITEKFKLEGAVRGQLIPLREVAVFLGVDVRTLQRDKSFPHKKVGRCYYCPVVSLARWLSV